MDIVSCLVLISSVSWPCGPLETTSIADIDDKSIFWEIDKTFPIKRSIPLYALTESLQSTRNFREIAEKFREIVCRKTNELRFVAAFWVFCQSLQCFHSFRVLAGIWR